MPYNNDKPPRMVYECRLSGCVSNVHPIHNFLLERDKMQFLLHLDEITERVRFKHEGVPSGFFRLVNLFNSPN